MPTYRLSLRLQGEGYPCGLHESSSNLINIHCTLYKVVVRYCCIVACIGTFLKQTARDSENCTRVCTVHELLCVPPINFSHVLWVTSVSTSTLENLVARVEYASDRLILFFLSKQWIFLMIFFVQLFRNKLFIGFIACYATVFCVVSD